MNKNILINCAIFAAGAALGSVVTWKLIDDKYRKITQDEIDSIREVYSQKTENIEETKAEEGMALQEMKDELERYRQKAEMYKSEQENKEEGECEDMADIYIITPDELGDNDNTVEILILYADGVLTDDYDNPIEDVPRMIGDDALNHFGEYEEDSVFVRNDKLGIDFEIQLDERNFADIHR